MWVALCYGISFLVYLIVLLWGLLGDSREFGYGLFSFYFILPVTSFIGAVVLSVVKTPWKWGYPVLFGVLGFAVSLVVFQRISQIPWWLFFVPGIIGVVIGMLKR